jgi:four helix bundle protein
MKRFNLEDRLVEFSVFIIEIINEMPKSKASNHLSGQLIRSGTSVSLNYGEAQSGESRRDFIHKLKVVLKELRETFVALKIIHQAKLYKIEGKIIQAKKENNELISIFVKSVQTAQKNEKLNKPFEKKINRHPI